MSESFRILGIAGSLRRASYNRALLDHAAACAPEGVMLEAYDGLGSLPHFSQDLEGEDTPAEVLDLRDRIAAADALLVVTPEYNSAMPGVLKNALDWASRPAGASPLAGKPAAAMGSSPGRFGGSRAQEQVRMVLTAIGADVLDQELAVAKVHESLAEDATVADPEVSAGLVALVEALIDHAGGPASARRSESAAYSRACQEQATAAG